MRNALWQLGTRALAWAYAQRDAARRDLETTRGKKAAVLGAAAGVLLGQAFAQNIIATATASASQYLCAAAKFFLGPLSWLLIAIAFGIGIVALAFGGRGALRWMFLSLIAAVVLAIGKAYFSSQVRSEGLSACF